MANRVWVMLQTEKLFYVFLPDRMWDIEGFVEGSLITSFHMANREWVTLHILWKAVSSYPFLWPTACEAHYKFCERQFHHIFFHDQQPVCDAAHFVKGFSSHLFLCPTASEWHCAFCERHWSHHIFSYDQQGVSGVAHFVKGSQSLITSLPMTKRKWVTLHISWKTVSTPSFPMTNSLWVTLHILCKTVSSHHFLWPTASEWHCIFCEKKSPHHRVFSYDQQFVSDIRRKPVSSHLFLWLTASE